MSTITSALGKGIGLGSMLGSQDAFIKKATEQQALSKAETQDKIELKETKLGEISQLQKILSSIKAKASMLNKPVEFGFNKKTPSTSTQDLGGADSYITNIRVDNTTHVGDTKVAVQQIATASELVLGLAPGAGFDKNTALAKTGNITLTVNGVPRIVAVVPGDTVEQIAAKINHVFMTAGDQFEAFLVEGNPVIVGGPNTSFIEVRAKNTGVGAITVAYNNGPGVANLGGGDMVAQGAPVAGQDAIVHINGIQRTQASNKFVNVVEGLSFELSGRVNAANVAPGNANYGGLNYSTVTVKEDHSNMEKMIGDFGDSLRELSYIIAKNQQSTRSVTQDKNADPSKLLESYDSSDSPLRGSPLMTEAMQIWERFTTKKVGGAGDITSIYQLGMGLQKTTKDGVEFQDVYWEDKSVFTKKFEDDFDAIRRFFVTNVKVTPTIGNLATVAHLPSQGDMPITNPQIVGKDIATSVTFDALGAVTAFTATVGGAVLNANIVHNPALNLYNVSFAKNSILQGMEFLVQPKGAIGVTEINVINYTPGMANLIQVDVTNMISDDGRRGSTIGEANLIQQQVTSLKDESTKVEKELKEFTAKLEREYQTIAQMDMMGALQVSMVEAALSSLTGASA